MAFTTPRGFTGGQMADIDYGIGAASFPWVETLQALAVTQPNGGTRTVSVAAGTVDAFGIRVTNDAPITQALAAPGSGAAWYMLAVRFTWATKSVALAVLPGPTIGGTTATAIPAVLPATMSSLPGSVHDVPLAWVFVNSANTTALIFDLRMSRTSFTLQPIALASGAVGVGVLQFVPLAPTMIACADGITYRALPNGTVKPWDSDWANIDPNVSGFVGSRNADPGFAWSRQPEWRYCGGRVLFRGAIRQTNGAVNAAPTINIVLPATARPQELVGTFLALDASTGTPYQLAGRLQGTTALGLDYWSQVTQVGQYGGVARWGLYANTPIPWADGDIYFWDLAYDPA